MSQSYCFGRNPCDEFHVDSVANGDAVSFTYRTGSMRFAKVTEICLPFSRNAEIRRSMRVSSRLQYNDVRAPHLHGLLAVHAYHRLHVGQLQHD